MQSGGRPPGSETPYVDIYNEKPVRVATKVLLPVKQHPKVRRDFLSHVTTGSYFFSSTLLVSCLVHEEVL